MRITTCNFKGGTGKTSIACNLALTLDYGIVTNDIYSPLDRVFNSEKFLCLGLGQELPNFPKEYNLVFDLGGYLDRRALKILRDSDFVIVPTTEDFNVLQTSINTIQEVKEYNDNIIIVANMIRNKKESDFIRKTIKENCGEYPVFDIKFSKSIKKIFTEKKSILAMTQENGLKKYHFGKIEEQFNQIINYIKKGK